MTVFHGDFKNIEEGVENCKLEENKTVNEGEPVAEKSLMTKVSEGVKHVIHDIAEGAGLIEEKIEEVAKELVKDVKEYGEQAKTKAVEMEHTLENIDYKGKAYEIEQSIEKSLEGAGKQLSEKAIKLGRAVDRELAPQQPEPPTEEKTIVQTETHEPIVQDIN